MGGKQSSQTDPVVEAFKNNYTQTERINDESFGEITLLRHNQTGELLALK